MDKTQLHRTGLPSIPLFTAENAVGSATFVLRRVGRHWHCRLKYEHHLGAPFSLFIFLTLSDVTLGGLSSPAGAQAGNTAPATTNGQVDPVNEETCQNIPVKGTED